MLTCFSAPYTSFHVWDGLMEGPQINTVKTQYHEKLNWKRNYILHYYFLTTFYKLSGEEHIEQYVIYENANRPDHRVSPT